MPTPTLQATEVTAVYLARVVGTDLHKIGISNSPEDRIQQFGPPCELVHVAWAQAARRVEDELLSRCDDYVVQGEWISPPEDVLGKIPDWMDSLCDDSPTRQKTPLPDAGQRTFTIEEVAVLLERSPQTVYRMIERGDLDAVKPGQSYTITRSHLREYVGGEDVLEDLEATANDEA